MKWFELARFIVPIVGVAVPGAAPFIPAIMAGVNEAEQLHADSDGATKKQHVLNLVVAGAEAATASGKVSIDPANALDVTNAVFSAVDAVHAIVKAQNKQDVPPVNPAPAVDPTL
jgi:hypothetical protein